MKIIFKIFKRDLKKIFTNSMAIILAVGIAVLPSLYAWINIYNNWDPYGNTGNMQVAVIIEDEGYSYRDIEINVGEQIKSNLQANDAIDWQFVSKKVGMQGVKSSKYYAAIEIPKGFSKSLTSIVTSDFKQPEITYYANEKKNAIATKITDKVVQTVQTEVNESFVETIVNVMNSLLGTVIGDEESSKANSTINNLADQLEQAQESVDAVRSTMSGFSKVMEITEKLNKALSKKNVKEVLNNADGTIQSTEDVVKVTKASVSSITSSLDTALAQGSDDLNSSANTIKTVGEKASATAEAELKDALSNVQNLETNLDTIINTLQTVNSSLPTKIDKIDSVVSDLNGVKTSLQTLEKTINTALSSGSVTDYTDSIAATMKKIASSLTTVTSDYKNNVKPKLTKNIDALLTSLEDLSSIIESISGDVPTLTSLADSLNESLDAGDNMVEALDKLLENTDSQLESLSKKLTGLSNSEIINAIINLTSQSESELGSFLACPVQVNTDKVYAVENYGSAMAPFYSTLAMWVGTIVLVAIIKTKVKNKKEIAPKVKPYQEYFGRGLLFVGFSVVQGVIICLGDLLFLRIQCYHPILFILTGVVASFVFGFFVYSVVAAWGDIGKAVAVILLVIQLGGASGTFPIDVTPAFFRAIYNYMPFTYVINAFRECVCGTYGADYWKDLLILLAYIPIALVIGTLFRWIFKNPIKLFNKRIEETGVL